MKTSQLKKLIKLVIKESVSLKSDSQFKDGVTDTMGAVNMEESVYLKNLQIPFSAREKEIMILSVKSFSKGGHVVPDKINIVDFGKDFVVQCLLKAEKLLAGKKKYVKDLSEVTALIKKLSQKKEDEIGIDEETSTGAVAGYSTPFAFTKNKKGSPKGIQAAKKYGKVVGEAPRV